MERDMFEKLKNNSYKKIYIENYTSLRYSKIENKRSIRYLFIYSDKLRRLDRTINKK